MGSGGPIVTGTRMGILCVSVHNSEGKIAMDSDSVNSTIQDAQKRKKKSNGNIGFSTR